MQAVILAGGLGTRLRPLTEQIPKVMVPVNDKPFLLHLLKLLKSQGVRDIVLCIGYLGGQIKDSFGQGESIGIRIRYNEEKARLLGTGGALKQAQHLLAEHFFVINGDTYLPIDYGEMEKAFLKCRKRALMAVYDNQEDIGVKNNVKLDNALMVVGYDKGSSVLGLRYVDAGVLVFRREVLELIEEGCPVSLENGLYLTLIQQRELAAYVTEQRFYDIGTIERQGIFEEFMKRKPK